MCWVLSLFAGQSMSSPNHTCKQITSGMDGGTECNLQEGFHDQMSQSAARVDTLLLGVERVVWMSGGHRWPPPSRQRPASAWATLSGRSRSMFGSLQADRRTGRGLVAATTTRVIHYHAHRVKQDLSHLQHNLNHTSEQLSGSRVYV